jgi:hypothetical protein
MIDFEGDKKILKNKISKVQKKIEFLDRELRSK